jgi:phosphomevalonate kinase
MSDARDTPIGTPVVLAPGRIMLVGEYAALAEGSTVEAAFGCYAKAQFIPQMDSVMTLVSEIIERVRSELADVAAALPPGSVLITSEDFRAAGVAAAGLGGSAAMAVAAVGAVLESLGLALEARKPLVCRIADAARRKTQGYLGAGTDTAAAAYGGLIRTGRDRDGQRQVVPLAPPSGLHMVVFSAGPALPPTTVVRALERYAHADAVAYLEAVAKLREAAQRFLDDASTGQTTAAVVAAGKYGEILQGLCAAAQAPIMTPAFTRAAELAREYGGIAKPTGAGGGEIGVALFATPEARQWFRRACSEPLVALEGDLDVAGVRCEFPDNAVGADLDERDSAEIPETEPDEFSMPTVKTERPIEISLHEAVTARNPAPGEAAPAAAQSAARSSRVRLWLAIVLVGLALVLLARFAFDRLVPMPAPSQTAPPHEEPASPPVASQPPAAAPAPAAAPLAPASQPDRAPALKHKREGRSARPAHPPRRAGRLSTDDF